MVGSPPPPERIIRFADDSWSQFPQLRWSYSNMRQLLPTAVAHRSAIPHTLPRAELDEIDALRFQPLGGHESMTWADSLEANYTDGILILHRGVIAYERYFGVLGPQRQHIAFSVTKSFVGTLAATLIDEGVLTEDATVQSYLPELQDSGIGDATLRELLDMTTGLDYSEDYADARAGVWDLCRAGGVIPRPPRYRGPSSFFEYLKTLRKSCGHGEQFSYKTVNTDALAAVLRRITGRSLSELLSERLFEPLGTEQDAFFTIDDTGAEFAGGGLNLTLRDLARFGEMMRLEGLHQGRRIVPAEVVRRIRRGGSRSLFETAAAYPCLQGWSYRDMWWVSHDAHETFMARGIHGQALYIDPGAGMVIARFASHPMAGNVNLDPTSLPAYAAVAEHLMAR
jgi:CubicO group peptidase (beta-lactamase class C family)